MAVHLIALYAAASITLLWIYQGLRNDLAHLPGPKASRWTGLILTYYWLRGQRSTYVHSLHQQYGPIVRTAPDEVSVADLDTFKEIHRAGGPYRNITDPQAHSHRRRLLATPISDSSLAHLEPIISGKVRLAVSRVGEEMKERGVADVFKWWMFMATDIIGELSFGRSFDMLEIKKKNQYIDDLERVSEFGRYRTTFPTLMNLAFIIPLPFFRHIVGAARRMIMYAAQSVARYRNLLAVNPSDPKPTLFTKLFNDQKSGMADSDIKQEAQGYIIAGSDTTAYTLTCLIYAVCKNPRIRSVLANEVAALPEGFTEKDTRNLQYLSCVISEALRVYPAVSGLPRRVPSEGTKFNGYAIPGGMTVWTQIYSLNRDDRLFPDPETFNPDRWINPTKEMKDALMTFGGGARICLGIHLARMELRLATSHFIRSYPHAHASAKEGMSDDDMDMRTGFLATVKGRRCLIEL